MGEINRTEMDVKGFTIILVNIIINVKENKEGEKAVHCIRGLADLDGDIFGIVSFTTENVRN